MQPNASRGVLAGLVVLLSFVSPAAAQSPKNLQVELQAMAGNIRTLLQGRKETAVTRLSFDCGNDDVAASSGPGISEALRLELQQLGIKVEPGARITLKGTYKGAVDDKTNRLMLALEMRVIDDKNVTLVTLARSAYGVDAVLSALAPTLLLPLDGDDKAQEDAVTRFFDKSAVHIANNLVKPVPECPYGVEVWVKEDGEYRPRRPSDEKGFAYVPLKRDDVYAIRLVNASDHEVAASVSIDGLHALSFSEINKDRDTGRPVLMPFLIPPRKSALIRGWPINLKKSDEFLVTEYAKSAANALKTAPGKVGTISVQFAAAWPRSGRPPADEPKGKSGDATGRGAPIDTPFQSEERKVGVTRAVISIRYTR